MKVESLERGKNLPYGEEGSRGVSRTPKLFKKRLHCALKKKRSVGAQNPQHVIKCPFLKNPGKAQRDLDGRKVGKLRVSVVFVLIKEGAGRSESQQF